MDQTHGAHNNIIYLPSSLSASTANKKHVLFFFCHSFQGSQDQEAGEIEADHSVTTGEEVEADNAYTTKNNSLRRRAIRTHDE